MPLDHKDIELSIVEDRPLSGMWHTGPNASWVTITHKPTRISVTMFDESMHRARREAMTIVEMMIESSRMTKCQFPERLEKR